MKIYKELEIKELRKIFDKEEKKCKDCEGCMWSTAPGSDCGLNILLELIQMAEDLKAKSEVK